MTLPGVLLASVALLVGLVIERLRLARCHRAIPLRIAVTGTRGKTSVARLLASVLREDGRRVLAKTTGSQATLVLPDGSVEEIRRRGQPSILEQKQLLHRGVELGADVVVAEIMSIHAENHLALGQQQPVYFLAEKNRRLPFHLGTRAAQNHRPGCQPLK